MSDFCEKIDFIPNSMYDCVNTSNGGVMMLSREIFDAAINSLGITQAEAARKSGKTPQQLNGKLTRNSMRADEYLEMMEAIGIDVEFRVRGTGEKVSAHKDGYGRRVRCMVNGVTYDTGLSEAVANNFWVDGKHEYNDGNALELYINKDGQYFFAEYSSWEGTKDRITPISDKVAADFVEKYGTEIFREHE